MAKIGDFNFESLVGMEVGTAVLLKELARGGMAVIFTAYQKTLKRQIAVKILPKALLKPSSAELFQQEAESIAILSHPNIIPIYETGETDDFLFFTMQLVTGPPLSVVIQRLQKQILPSRRFFPADQAVRLLTQVLDALEYAHGQGIIHRDVKPGNILIESHTNRPLITDFGIARVLRGRELTGPRIIGSPVYMAPEQIIDQPADARVDVYAVGVTLFELLAAELPLPDYHDGVGLLKMKILMKDRFFQKKPCEMNSRVHPEMDAIISRATAFNPDERYRSCREFAAGLKDYLKHHGEGAR